MQEIQAWHGLSDTSNTIPGTIFAIATTEDTDPLNVSYDGETGVDY